MFQDPLVYVTSQHFSVGKVLNFKMSSSVSCRNALVIALAYSGTVDTLKVVKELLRKPDAFTNLERHWIVLTIFHYAFPTERTLPVAKVSTLKLTEM